MIPLNYIFTPLIAAGIGYVTNDIAIRMLFRPHKAKHIFGRRVWFTPGVIPKEKGRIAASIGEAISANLMNHDVMKETLLSDEMLQKVGIAFDELVAKLTDDREPLRDYLSHYMAEEELVTLEKSATQELSIMVADKLVNSGLGKQIAHIAVEHALDKMQHGVAGLFRVDKVLSLVQGPTESHLAKNIDEMHQGPPRTGGLDTPRHHPALPVGNRGTTAEDARGARHQPDHRTAHQRDGHDGGRTTHPRHRQEGTEGHRLVWRPAGLPDRMPQLLPALTNITHAQYP